jgi:heme exporter protein A
MPAGPGLRVSGLACARGGVRVLEGLSFDLSSGRALVLRGPNGSGKTTLLRTIAGLQPAVDGEISLPPESLAYAGHADGVKAVLTVAENLGFWAAVHGTRGIDAAIEAMGLRLLVDRQARNLSAGQKRRLSLARLLVTGRPIWLLDEPTVSLDTASVVRFAKAVQAHLAGGGAVLIATHIDLGLEAAATLDLAPYRAAGALRGGFDESFG